MDAFSEVVKDFQESVFSCSDAFTAKRFAAIIEKIDF